MSRNEGTDIFDVVIIGGGFSGLMALHHLVRTGSSGSLFAIVEPDENLGHGLAYCTANPRHLLNVPAGNMSALPDQPDHFVKWLLSENGHKASNAIGIDRAWQSGDYVPRCLYAGYLDDIALETYHVAKIRGIIVRHLRQKAADIEQSHSSGLYRVELEDEHTLQSRTILLATGNLSANDTGRIPDLVTDPWRYDYTSIHNESGTVAVIGTGLTMVDTALSLREAGFAGKILAVSRRGLLPEVHHDTPAVNKAPSFSPAAAPEKLIPLMQFLRGEAKSYLSNQIVWQRVFDRWRPHVAAVWGKLDTDDRNRFFDRLFTLWNIHRHRMAPEVGAFVDRELATGGLKILKGNVQVLPSEDGFCLTVGEQQHVVKKVFDCRGTCYDVSLSGNRLIQNLYRKGLIQQHETGWGIKISGDLQVMPSGLDGSFLTIGAAMIGARLETTAVPELRQQAQKAAFALADVFSEGSEGLGREANAYARK